MADNAGDNGGEWMLIMTDADRKRVKKTTPDTDSRRRNKLTLTGAPSVTTNTSLHGNPSSSGWETRAKKTDLLLPGRTAHASDEHLVTRQPKL